MKERPPAIFFIPTLEAGGAERVCLLLVNSLTHFQPNLALQYSRGELLAELSPEVPLIDLSPVLLPKGRKFHPLLRLRAIVQNMRASIRSWLWYLRNGLRQFIRMNARMVRRLLKASVNVVRNSLKSFLSAVKQFVKNHFDFSNITQPLRQMIPMPIRRGFSYAFESMARGCGRALRHVFRLALALGQTTWFAIVGVLNWMGKKSIQCIKWLTTQVIRTLLRVSKQLFRVIGAMCFHLIMWPITFCLNQEQRERLAAKFRLCFWEPARQKLLALDATMSKHSEWLQLPARCAFLFKQARQLARSTRRRECQLVLSFLPYTNAIAILSKLIFNRDLKVVINVHSVKSKLLRTISHFDEVLIRFLVKRLYGRANLIVAVAQGVKKDLIESFGLPAEKIIVINNPIDLDHIRKMAKEKVKLPNPELSKGCLVVAVGRLTRVKGFDLLINAMSAIPEQMNCHLMIIGDGEEKEYLQELARAKGLNGRINFLGFKKNPWKYMRHADCLVLSSRTEALPNVIGEALALDLPIVATDCSLGVREYLQDGRYGILVPPDDEAQLANKLEQTLKDTDLRHALALRAGERAAHFDLHRITKQFETVLLHVMLDEIPPIAREI